MFAVSKAKVSMKVWLRIHVPLLLPPLLVLPLLILQSVLLLAVHRCCLVRPPRDLALSFKCLSDCLSMPG